MNKNTTVHQQKIVLVSCIAHTQRELCQCVLLSRPWKELPLVVWIMYTPVYS